MFQVLGLERGPLSCSDEGYVFTFLSKPIWSSGCVFSAPAGIRSPPNCAQLVSCATYAGMRTHIADGSSLFGDVSLVADNAASIRTFHHLVPSAIPPLLKKIIEREFRSQLSVFSTYHTNTKSLLFAIVLLASYWSRTGANTASRSQ